MKDTTIAVGLAKNVFEIAISREAGKVSNRHNVRVAARSSQGPMASTATHTGMEKRRILMPPLFRLAAASG